MAIIAPTITATTAQDYRAEMARIAPFAQRIHIDFCDGEFAPTRLVNPIQAYWPDGIIADLHLMFKRPLEHIETVISLKPDLVIVHAEAEGDLLSMMRELRAVGIKCGVALLPATDPATCHDLIAEADHVLIFSGDLGHFGGTADMLLLNKVAHIRAINTYVEIGWDGGISADNVSQLQFGGIEVFDVGGAIHKAPDPQEAYATLESSIQKVMDTE